MKWRCTWCGKPHENNDPPCDNCGHGEFEEAVVQVQDVETVDTGTQYVWACPNCGRAHVKNSPPCSRCGNPDLEKTEQDYADIESDLDVPSWFEVAKPYAPIFLVFGIVAALFLTGIVSPSVIPGIGSPSPPDAPGNADAAAGIDFAEVEQGVHERLEAERNASRGYDSGLAGIAASVNAQNVLKYYNGTEPEGVDWTEFDPSCAVSPPTGQSLESFDRPVGDYESDDELADEIATVLLSSNSESVESADRQSEALDIHAGPDGELFVFYVSC